jgi:hypothetical protein
MLEFFYMVGEPHRSLAQQLIAETERLIRASQQLAGIEPSSDLNKRGNTHEVNFEEDPAIAAMLFERLAERFSSHGVGISAGFFKTAIRVMAFVAEMQRKDSYFWQERCGEWEPGESSYECWSGLWDGEEEEVLVSSTAD